jgi:hypothetical protein
MRRIEENDRSSKLKNNLKMKKVIDWDLGSPDFGKLLVDEDGNKENFVENLMVKVSQYVVDHKGDRETVDFESPVNKLKKSIVKDDTEYIRIGHLPDPVQPNVEKRVSKPDTVASPQKRLVFSKIVESLPIRKDKFGKRDSDSGQTVQLNLMESFGGQAKTDAAELQFDKTHSKLGRARTLYSKLKNSDVGRGNANQDYIVSFGGRNRFEDSDPTDAGQIGVDGGVIPAKDSLVKSCIIRLEDSPRGDSPRPSSRSKVKFQTQSPYALDVSTFESRKQHQSGLEANWSMNSVASGVPSPPKKVNFTDNYTSIYLASNDGFLSQPQLM